jgi:hypothetical protein
MYSQPTNRDHYIHWLTNECIVDPDECQNFVPMPIPFIRPHNASRSHSVSYPKSPPPPFRRCCPCAIATCRADLLPPAATESAPLTATPGRLIPLPLEAPPPAALARCHLHAIHHPIYPHKIKRVAHYCRLRAAGDRNTLNRHILVN